MIDLPCEDMADAVIDLPCENEQAPAPHITLQSLCRRKPNFGVTSDTTILRDVEPVPGQRRLCRDYRPLQQMWNEYATATHKCCSSSFWLLFRALHLQSTVCRDKVLTCVKDLLKVKGQSWPRSCRQLKSRVRNVCTPF